MMLLKALSIEPMHGFGLSKWIRAQSGEALTLEDAALYQGLHRIERHGWVTSEWRPSENNRRAKYYTLAPAGRAQLRRETAAWRVYATALFQVLDTPKGGS